MAEPLNQYVTRAFFLANGTMRDPSGLTSLTPASNVCRLEIYIEDGVSTNGFMANFRATNKGYPTSVFFPMFYKTTESWILSGETEPRTFAKVWTLVPPQVLQWNANGTGALPLDITVVQTAGDGLLGVFADTTALQTDYPASEALDDDNAVAYVLGGSYGFYMVAYDSGEDTYSWELIDNPITQMNMVDSKQYDVIGASIQKGNLPRPTATVSISDEYIRLMMTFIAQVNADTEQNTADIAQAELDIAALEQEDADMKDGTSEFSVVNIGGALVR